MATKPSLKGQLIRKTVLLGKFKAPKRKGVEAAKDENVYSFVTKRALTNLSLDEVDLPKGDKGRILRGSVGAGSLRLSKTDDGKFYSIPIPGWLKVEDMITIAKKYKAVRMITPRGRSYSIKAGKV